MTFELSVWGPALELPSIDPQCLAAIAYLSYVSRRIDSQLHWQIVANNDPSICPTKELPALKDTTTGTIIGGLQNIIDYLRAQNPLWDLGHDLEDDPTKVADLTAFTSHISTRGNILLALYFFVSTENYTATIRPAYSSILSWPTQYIIPPTLRSKARQLTAHLGLSSPDLDNDEEDASRSNKSIIPDSLRTLNTTSPPKSLTETLAHHQRSTRFRLEALADDFCAPLASLLTHPDHGETPYLLSDSNPSTIDSLASAYLNLFLHPALPQAWLRTRIRSRWPRLAEYAQRTSLQFWGPTPPSDHAAAAAAAARNNSSQEEQQFHLPWHPPPEQNVLSRTITSLLTTYLPHPTTIIISTPTPPSLSTTIATDDGAIPPPPSQKHPSAAPPHSIPTVLLTATALAAGLAAVSSYLLLPSLVPSTAAGEGRARGRKLSEMGEAGAMLSGIGIVGLEAGRVGVGESVEL